MESEKAGMRLLKKGQKGILKMIFSPTGVILLLLALNIGLLLAAFGWFQDFLPHVYGGTALFVLGMVLYIINSSMDPTAKITWLVVIMLLPVFGSLFYLFTRTDVTHKAMGKKLQKHYSATRRETASSTESLRQQDPGAGALAGYVAGITGIPVSSHTKVSYFPSGEEMLSQLLTELKKAEKTIFLEFFIIDEGVMWGQILEILAEKAAQGVDVRVMYDGACEFTLLPKGYPKKLKALGIQCRVFSPVTPFVTTCYNYRDHRKILVIDGRVAFTGGINLADEYINQKKLFGHWKDTAIMLRGDSAKSFETMFLHIWHLGDREFSHPQPEPNEKPFAETDGFVLPYFDDPLDREQVGKQVYLDILARAQRYVYIMTPYLILDGELEAALIYAAKRGVDVTLLLPGIPDKKLPWALAKSHYPALVQAGVRIYEYTPGFVHAKVVVSDDREAVVGSINFDYRSLYHHFECAVYMYHTACIDQISRDFAESVRKSRAVTRKTIGKEKLFYRITGKILKVFATLM